MSLFTPSQQVFMQSLHERALHDYNQVDYNDRFMAIDALQGEYLAAIVRQNNYRIIVEFGSSLGISTCYFAAAAKQTGGRVIATEKMLPKVDRLQSHLHNMELEQFVDVRPGDAKETLKTLQAPIDFIFLDGQKNDYWELFTMLFPLLTPQGMLIADNTDTRFAADFNDRIVQYEGVQVGYKQWERSTMTIVKHV